MKVLLVKTSSLGDIVHTFPALTDAQRALPGIQFDWVVEEAFADIAAQHSAVNRVIPCALRRWRKHPIKTWRNGEWAEFKQRLRSEHYDLVIDAQGLIKSAFVTRLLSAPKAGLDARSAREPLSAKVLDSPIAVPWGQHAIERVRQLFSQALHYPLPDSVADSGLQKLHANEGSARKKLLFFHGTTWASKHWPSAYWRALAEIASAHQVEVSLPWADELERQRAQQIAYGLPGVELLERQPLAELFSTIQMHDGFVAVDTGLAHLACAAGLPGVVLYGPTSPGLTGATGAHTVNLAAEFHCAPCLRQHCQFTPEPEQQAFPPCFAALTAQRVWDQLVALGAVPTLAANNE